MITRSLIDRFHAAGLTVVELAGWESRGEGGSFNIQGILLHHDGMGLHNDNVPNYMSGNGVNGAQLWIKYTGEIYILAAGLKWHAGVGGPWNSIPQDNGNAHLVGIETDHTDNQPWYPEQLHTINVAGQCIVQEYGIDVPNWCCGHKEYTGPQSDCPGRKNDPESFDLNAWRLAIAAGPQPIDTGLSAAEAAQINAYLDAKFAAVAASKASQYGAARLINGRFGLSDTVQAVANKLNAIPKPAKK